MADSDDFIRPDPIIGTPLSDSEFFPGRQSYSDTCAIRCQEFIIRQYTGLDAPEKFFVDEARSHGWYEDGRGTDPADIGKLLELHGIPVHRYMDANPWQLAVELGQGHKVIIGVDSDELWRGGRLLRDIGRVLDFGTADHAVVVSGIDTSDPERPSVIISDPATGEAAASYPMAQFISAWKDSHFFMVATQQPPPEDLHLPEMSHFDYDAGHVEHVGALSWDAFLDLYDAHDDPVPHAHHEDHDHSSPYDHIAAPDSHDILDDHGDAGHHDAHDDGGHHDG